jgi:hypothetical protein
MDDTEKLLNYNRQRRREAKFKDEKCLFCPESDPLALERHHVAGRAADKDLEVVVCANHHRIATARQLDFGVNLSHADDRDLLDKIQSWLLSIAAFLTDLADSLYKSAQTLPAFIQFLDERLPTWREDFASYLTGRQLAWNV